MKTFIVSTQYLENYGAHDQTAVNQHDWKPKGGFNYKVVLHDHSRDYDAIGVVSSLECKCNHYAAEYVISCVSEEEWMESLSEDSEEFRQYKLETLVELHPHQYTRG